MKQQQKFIPVFLYSWAIILGVFIRIYAAWKAGFPMVDGGMFLVMARDLQASHYFLPLVTSYNHIQIPYAYPPLGFYLLAGINGLFGTNLLSLLQWLPAIFSALTIPAFALLAHRILGTNVRAALATLIYGLTPQAFEWQLMGGGLTRALGAIFASLVLYFAIRMFREKSNKMLAGTILMGALTIISHPEWALQAATGGILVWWFFGRNKAGSLRALAAGLGIIILSAPWWATVAARHGLGIFLTASQTPQDRLLFWWPLASMSFGGAANILVFGRSPQRRPCDPNTTGIAGNNSPERYGLPMVSGEKTEFIGIREGDCINRGFFQPPLPGFYSLPVHCYVDWLLFFCFISGWFQHLASARH
jgi:hypothetical protein